MTTLPSRKSIGLSPLRLAFLLIPLVIACFGLSPVARAVVPAPDGGYPGFNTAEGEDALFSLTTGTFNTAIGVEALYHNTRGFDNTATGAAALLYNTTGNYNTATGALALVNNTGSENTATGFQALYVNRTGFRNTATGVQALYVNNGSSNTATGYQALLSNSSATNNTANGASALLSNTTGDFNTANGASALFSNTTGGSNAANGARALHENTTGDDNTATGFQALLSNISGNSNTANGASALFSNTTADNNTANGKWALFSNTSGGSNTANGANALQNNRSGSSNTANGRDALYHNTTGRGNTANGASALFSNTTALFNTAMGFRALFNTTGFGNIALGFGAGENLTTGSSNIDIGNQGVAGETQTIRIGRQGTQTATFIAGISGVALTGTQVVVNSNGRLGVAASSARLKEAIKPMDKASEAIHALKPVTFRYKPELDPEKVPQFGLVAEEVEKVNPDLVARDDQGKIYTVRYDAVNAMLLNEFLKEHRIVQELKSTAEKQEAIIAQQQKQIEAITAGLQKVSDQLELNKPAPQIVNNR